LASGSNLCILEGHSTKHTINSVAFSADNNALTSGSSDCTVRIWDLLSSVEDAKNKAFSTKYSPVYHVGYTSHNVLCAGGPFVLPSKLSAASTSEIQTISALGLGVAMQQGV
jgi:WD40 repeat protein